MEQIATQVNIDSGDPIQAGASMVTDGFVPALKQVTSRMDDQEQLLFWTAVFGALAGAMGGALGGGAAMAVLDTVSTVIEQIAEQRGEALNG